MVKFTSIALSCALGAAGLAHSPSAEAHPYFRVGVALPGIAVVPPVVAYAPGPYYAPYVYGPYVDAHGPYWYGHGPYWHRGFNGYGRYGGFAYRR